MTDLPPPEALDQILPPPAVPMEQEDVLPAPEELPALDILPEVPQGLEEPVEPVEIMPEVAAPIEEPLPEIEEPVEEPMPEEPVIIEEPVEAPVIPEEPMPEVEEPAPAPVVVEEPIPAPVVVEEPAPTPVEPAAPEPESEESEETEEETEDPVPAHVTSLMSRCVSEPAACLTELLDIDEEDPEMAHPQLVEVFVQCITAPAIAKNPASFIKGLTPGAPMDSLMRYLYRSFDQFPASSLVALSWHKTLVAEAGLGGIVRVISDTEIKI